MTAIPALDVELDLLVIGSGVAGLSAAVHLLARQPGARVGVLTKAALATSATQWAQGGVAAVLSGPRADASGDSIDLHRRDTLAAGAGLCDDAAVRLLVSEGPGAVRALVAQGASFDLEADGSIALAREGGHSAARVLHAGGLATGAEIERTLVAATRAHASTLLEGWYVADLIVERGACRGVLAFAPDGSTVAVRAAATLLATGGAGQLFAVTTNPPQATADGLAMALRGGVAVADIEFVQFHPTALADGGFPRPLLSEALRGDGALLRDGRGRRFVDELQPRDVVSRAIAATLGAEGAGHVWLDATPIDDFALRFPTLMPPLERLGIDPAHDWIPVAPAAHYLCGGVVTDLDGATTMPGLWAAGEAACTGVHGANRLASNSLLEGMVFGARVVDAVVAGRAGPRPTGAMTSLLEPSALGHLPVVRLDTTLPPVPSPSSGADHPRPAGGPAAAGPAGPDVAKARAALAAAMTAGAGVVRSAASLAEARRAVAATPLHPGSPAGAELVNLATAAAVLLDAADARLESRGGHSRSDAPATSADFLLRFCR
ncbi:MAG TPA: FAD-binding protein [Acidimicrobiales bacterium]|nr:FAD-binding protein [Acidimicrobiales bacterium]